MTKTVADLINLKRNQKIKRYTHKKSIQNELLKIPKR